MTEPVLLNNTTHARLRVAEGLSIDKLNVRNTAVILKEFPLLALNFPIFFTKNLNTGSFSCVAVFGFDENENLFIENGNWSATYLPLNMRRQPFMVGMQSNKIDADNNEECLVFIDAEDPRVGEDEGTPLFNERGFPTQYMEKMTSLLKTLRDGYIETQAFINKVLELNLIAPAKLKIKFENQDERLIEGLYAIDYSKLQSLPSEDVASLHALGFLEAIYSMHISFGHVNSLIAIRNKRAHEQVKEA